MKIFLKQKKTKSKNMGANVIEISEKMKNKKFLNMEKNMRCQKVKICYKQRLTEVLYYSKALTFSASMRNYRKLFFSGKYERFQIK